jgi:hypothetical protein
VAKLFYQRPSRTASPAPTAPAPTAPAPTAPDIRRELTPQSACRSPHEEIRTAIPAARLLLLTGRDGGRCEHAALHLLTGIDATALDRAAVLSGLQSLVNNEERFEPGKSNPVLWSALIESGLHSVRESSAAPRAERRMGL